MSEVLPFRFNQMLAANISNVILSLINQCCTNINVSEVLPFGFTQMLTANISNVITVLDNKKIT